MATEQKTFNVDDVLVKQGEDRRERGITNILDKEVVIVGATPLNHSSFGRGYTIKTEDGKEYDTFSEVISSKLDIVVKYNMFPLTAVVVKKGRYYDLE